MSHASGCTAGVDGFEGHRYGGAEPLEDDLLLFGGIDGSELAASFAHRFFWTMHADYESAAQNGRGRGGAHLYGIHDRADLRTRARARGTGSTRARSHRRWTNWC